MKKISVGLVLTDNNKILLCHSTGNVFYDIPKGLNENNEDFIDTCIREVKEETGIDINKNNLIDLGLYKYNKQKDLYLYKLIVNSLPNLKDLKCISTCINKFNGETQLEVDGYIYCDIINIKKYCTENMFNVLKQVFPIVDELENIKNKEKEEKIDEFLNKLKNKVKINRATGEAYLPIHVIYGVKRNEKHPIEFKWLPWILGAYTHDSGLQIQDDMQNTILYGHLYWTNQTIYLDKDFKIENYIEHLIECPRCHQIYSDKFSNFAPNKNSVCTLCEYKGYNECSKNKNKCNYEYKNDFSCNDCFLMEEN